MTSVSPGPFRRDKFSPYIDVISLTPVFYSTSTRGTVLFTSLIKCVSLNSVLNAISSIIQCHGAGRLYQDTGVREKKDWEARC